MFFKRKDKIKSFGFFNIDKPSGITSSTVVNKCKWLTGTPCGHMGTLDPLASGVLPVGVGNATRLFDYFLEKEKEYIAEFTFGVTSDTLDSTGERILGGTIPSETDIIAVLPTLIGEVSQMPPKYSAKNINGHRGYELARAGVEFELKPKLVKIYGIELLGKSENENAFRFKINCGGGTYIRSIARDLATALDTQALMSALYRTKSGIFTVDKSIPYSLLEQDPTVEELESYLIPTQAVLPYESLVVTGKVAEKIFNGLAVETDKQDGLYALYREENFYGIAEVKDGKAKAKTKLC